MASARHPCRVPDCPRPAIARGWCKHHWQRWKRTGDPLGHRPRPKGHGSFSNGYRMLSIDGTAVLEHRLVMSQILGRPLTRQEVVHHLDENRANNRPENLMLTTPAEHSALHAKLFRNATHKECGQCHAVLPRILFFRCTGKGDPNGWLCKTCELARQQAWNPERNRRRRLRRAAARQS